MLRPGFFMPPLMFSPDELEALVLGARWVQAQPDDGLAGAARNALAKIATASPDDLRDRIGDTGLWPVQMFGARKAVPLLGTVRTAMRAEQTLDIDYEDEHGNATTRAVWPVALAYYEGKQILAAWCTMRDDFRNFRTDRIVAARVSPARYGRRRAVLVKEWELTMPPRRDG
jgi:predicted DNA-binding transcriptional regulator YafY